MKIIPFLPEYFTEISDHLHSGFPVIFPTETCYGFSGNITSSLAVSRVEKIKKRKNKAFLVLAHSFSHISPYADISSIPLEWKEKSEKIPLSFLVKKKEKCPVSYFSDFPEIAFRVPLYPPLLGFLQFHKIPIFSTSVNISGFSPLYTEEEICSEFGKNTQILFVSVGDLPRNPPSELVRFGIDGVEKLR